MLEDTLTQTTIDIIEKFNKAFNQHDVPAVMALMTDDCLFDNTYPAPELVPG